MDLGIYTFAEVTLNPRTGQAIHPAQRLRDLLEEFELADQVGLDVFASASITAPTSPSRPRPWSSPPRPSARGASASPAP